MDDRVREAHHRIKNDFQILAGRLTRDIREADSECCVQRLRKHLSSLMSLATLHDRIFNLESEDRLSVSDVLGNLLRSAADALVGEESVDLLLSMPERSPSLKTDRIVTLTVVLNELITNSLQHGFVDGSAGTIRIQALCDGNHELNIQYSDNGSGFPANPDPSDFSSGGLGIVRFLVEDELNGSLELTDPKSAQYQISVPLDPS